MRIKNSFQIAALIKPQFEVGAEVARKRRGIISDPKIHEQVLVSVLEKLASLGFAAKELTYSPICGGDGNREYLVLLEPAAQAESGEFSSQADAITAERIREVVAEAFAEVS